MSRYSHNLCKDWIDVGLVFDLPSKQDQGYNHRLYSLDCGIIEVYTLGSMVPMGGGSSGLVKLRSGCVGRTQAVGMVRPLPA